MSIIANKDVLDEEYIPPNLPGREPQMKEMEACLYPCINKEKPINSLLFGKTGTGKTATARYVLSQLEKHTPADGLYINCWQAPSLHSIIEKVLTQLRILNAFQQNTALRLEALEKKLKGQLVIVLDEIDWPSPRERNAILYNLSTIENVGLVLICNSRTFILTLDDRVKSRINPVIIEFKKYSDNDLIHILRQRAELGLRPKAWSNRILGKISDISAGDARVAIQTLRNAAIYAEKMGKNTITCQHIKEGWEHAKDIKRAYALEKMTHSHHKILYQIIKEKEVVASTLLLNDYKKSCKGADIRPVAKRTFYLYLNELMEHRLVKARARGRERDRIFEVC